MIFIFSLTKIYYQTLAVQSFDKKNQNDPVSNILLQCEYFGQPEKMMPRAS